MLRCICYRTQYHHQHFLSSIWRHRASTIFFQPFLFLATACASSHNRFTSASLAITFLRQVASGRSRFVFPGGVRGRANLGIRSVSYSKDVTKPSQALTLDLENNAVAACLLKEFHVGYFITPEYLADLP